LFKGTKTKIVKGLNSMITRILVSAILLVIWSGCNKTISKEDQLAINEEIQSRKIRRITDAQLYEAALNLGNQISETSQKTLGAELMEQVSQNGPESALKYCNLKAYPIVDSLSQQFKAKIRRASLNARNPEDEPSDLERQLLEAYEYNLENALEVSPGVQKLDDGSFLYTKPILAGNGMCLKCHGKIGEEVSEDVAAAIAQKYPNDNATGHEINDLRGMWSIKLDRKEIIKSIEF
jgi:uncharacterized cupredoxin-like copper-binding protein